MNKTSAFPFPEKIRNRSLTDSCLIGGVNGHVPFVLFVQRQTLTKGTVAICVSRFFVQSKRGLINAV